MKQWVLDSLFGYLINNILRLARSLKRAGDLKNIPELMNHFFLNCPKGQRVGMLSVSKITIITPYS